MADQKKETRISSKRPRFEIIAKALEQSGGLVSPAADALKIHRTTLHGWLRDDPELQKAKESARERVLDLAESKLIANIKEGKEASIFFTLKTLGKKRGFVERHEFTGADGGPVQIIGTQILPPLEINEEEE